MAASASVWCDRPTLEDGETLNQQLAHGRQNHSARKARNGIVSLSLPLEKLFRVKAKTPEA
jgi:hypothetical protein